MTKGFLTVRIKKDESWNGLYAVFPGKVLVFVNIDYEDLEISLFLLFDLPKDGPQLPARDTVIGSKIHEHRPLAFQGL